ncbi:acetyl-CoA C-acetyltransferase [Azotobacter beijerinckii]|uniref:Acetyl-CoA C-acetyltransferase n=1 Tax=Azotobacter beijerinckii TaxID=170623 RepID=A0A1H6V614_9GAMM|nr:acetyl-CoA C-acyltransferase [Azotobacter beijerinckii]SEI84525.1 acetyl-CoA C-acetyltransferase [Azotobacter beijerinckii]SEJ00023.1 acetyl-CoA C-acetyltransferase [Azotobacter beijerinckii]
MSHDPVVIVSAARTPLGGFQGELSSLSAPQLGGVAVRAALERAGLPGERVQELILGCVLPAGLGQAPARQAAIEAGLPLSVGCTTVNKVCGSGMKAAMLAHDLLLAGTAEVMLAGGMESMSNAPYLMPGARGGYRLGHRQVLDHMFFDGLEDAYFDRGRLMGTFAEDCAASYGFTREEQDAWAMTSTSRARAAIESGAFAWEIVPVKLAGRKGKIVLERDEQPPKARLERIPELKPAFREGGTVTAANSSSIADGAAALLLMRRSTAGRLGLAPLATVVGHASHAHEPRLFSTAPVGAMRRMLERAGWTTGDVDLWEINEAFAVVTLAAIRDLELDPGRVNVHGGACALGHPIGASGARILVSLLGALRRSGGRRGIASLCIGGGEATAIAVEMA